MTIIYKIKPDETSMANTFDTQEHDYLRTPKGWKMIATGFNPWYKRKTKPVLAGFLPEGSKNRDKTQNIE